MSIHQRIGERLGRVRVELIIGPARQTACGRRHSGQRRVERGDCRREARRAGTLMIEATIHFDHSLQTAIELDQIRRLRVITVRRKTIGQREGHAGACTPKVRVRGIE